jgi:hypothetical protein
LNDTAAGTGRGILIQPPHPKESLR